MLQRRDDDLPFGLGLEIMKRARDRVRVCSPTPGVLSNLARNVVDADRVAVHGDDHPLDDVPQLADVVASPIVPHQTLDRSRLDCLGARPEVRAGGGQQVLDECGDVGPALAQGRHAERVNVQAVVDILAEPSGLYLRFEIPVGSGEDTR